MTIGKFYIVVRQTPNIRVFKVANSDKHSYMDPTWLPGSPTLQLHPPHHLAQLAPAANSMHALFPQERCRAPDISMTQVTEAQFLAATGYYSANTSHKPLLLFEQPSSFDLRHPPSQPHHPRLQNCLSFISHSHLNALATHTHPSLESGSGQKMGGG
jgi:hypothetical protein